MTWIECDLGADLIDVLFLLLLATCESNTHLPWYYIVFLLQGGSQDSHMDRGFGYKFPQVNRIKIWRIEREGLYFCPFPRLCAHSFFNPP